ncbi:MAG: glycine--tRNA ligase [Candidatus Pacearchaeota archaeon]|nr:glycine--tRNA ligase [Candidatus Pacearchaeota archaeon]
METIKMENFGRAENSKKFSCNKKEDNKIFDKVAEIAASRGFFWPTAEIYSDKLAGFFEYGPNGLALKNNILQVWREELIEKENMIEIDGCQILPKSVFQASGHLKNFDDPLITCSKCGFKTRADKLIQDITKQEIPEKLENEKYDELLKKNKIVCPKCKSFFNKTERWNMMLKTGVGAELKEAYFRPETCQSIFVNFPRIFKTCRVKLPFGIAQTGKVFRNEIAPRQGLIREREINQMEIEIFFNPEKENDFNLNPVKKEILPIYLKDKLQRVSSEESVKKNIVKSKLVAYYLSRLKQFYLKLGIPEDKMRFRYVNENDRPFYSKETWDFEVQVSTGWLELCACNHRGDYDLSGHQKASKQSFEIVDESVGKKILPNVFELSAGVDRTLYAILELTYKEEPKDDRTIFSFPKSLSPVQVAIFPLVNKEGMPELSKKVYALLKPQFKCFYDESGSIGRRYRRQDEIGTMWCITVDGQTLKDNSITIRNRDNMTQIRLPINKIIDYLNKSSSK